MPLFSRRNSLVGIRMLSVNFFLGPLFGPSPTFAWQAAGSELQQDRARIQRNDRAPATVNGKKKKSFLRDSLGSPVEFPVDSCLPDF